MGKPARRIEPVSAAPHARRLSRSELLCRAEHQPRHRFERLAGTPVAIAPGRWAPSPLKARIWRALAREIRAAGLPCEAAPDGMTVEIDDDTDAASAPPPAASARPMRTGRPPRHPRRRPGRAGHGGGQARRVAAPQRPAGRAARAAPAIAPRSRADPLQQRRPSARVPLDRCGGIARWIGPDGDAIPHVNSVLPINLKSDMFSG